MSTARSQDGTAIVYDRSGEGPPLVVVGGAFSHRSWKGFVELAGLLSHRLAVVNYDRRGRGDSGDAPAYAVEREIEDLAAVVEAVGGRAHAFGMSSGGVLALRAAAAGVPIDRLVVYQPPFTVDGSDHVPPPDLGPRLQALTDAGRRSDAVRYFMRRGMGVPAPFVGMMRLARPLWRNLEAVAHTLPYDYAVMGDTTDAHPLPADPWSSVATPTLVLDGGKSPAQLHRAADQLAAWLPDGKRRTLEGQSHNVSMKVLAPAIAEFVA